MPEFHLECQWEVRHIFHVEADTLEEAKDKLENAEPPYDSLPRGEMIDDTFEVIGEA